MPTTENPLRRLATLSIILAVPVVLIAVNVRLLASEAFLRFEYGRPHFPAAPGFSDKARLALAVPSTLYIVGAGTDDDLAALTHDGRPLYTAGEVQHLVDVRRRVVVLSWLALAAGAGIVGAVLLAWRRRSRALARAIDRGGWLTLALVAATGTAIGAVWPWFFTTFHEVLFPPGTWQFPEDSGLIRLFPGVFWYDSAIVLAGLTAAEAVALVVVGRALGRRARK